MLRALDEKGGVGVYTRYITEELLGIDQRNEYFLFYKNAANLGRYAHYPNVTEKVLRCGNKLWWDQVLVPVACVRHGVDVLFHPKFTVPLLAPCKTVMVLHGAGWFMKGCSGFWSDLKYVRAAMPLYCRKAAAILAVSQITTDTFNEKLHVKPGKIQTVYFGPGKQFRKISDEQELQRVRQKYNLPERFILTLSGYDRGERKNIRGILNAYRLLYGKIPHKLVIGGKDCHKFKEDYQIPDSGYGKDIIFTDWIEQQDLPVFYSLADLYLYPSYSEAFPIPITEALACGTPIVTSNVNGLVEIAGDAALHVNPDDPLEIADALLQVLTDRDLHKNLAMRGLERSRTFSWDRCAQKTLQIIETVGERRAESKANARSKSQGSVEVR